MAKNITLMGASYSDVPAVDLPQTGGGTARFVDTSDANANQYALLEGATAYANGEKITGVIPQLTEMDGDIGYYYFDEDGERKWGVEGHFNTNNGGVVYPGARFDTGVFTFNAIPANTVITPTSQAQTVGGANWMMEGAITINPSSGGASNFVTGTFTTPSTTSTNGTVTVPYTGTGYPIALMIFVEGGCYNSAISGWYNSMTRYAVGQYCITKANTTLAPTYGTSGGANQGTVQLLFKNSTTSATSYSSTRSIGANSYSSSNANGTSTTSVRWRSNTLISYRTAGGTSSTYGLLEDTTYRYIAVYSQ